MKVLVSGLYRNSGVGKESNRPFDICNLHVLVPLTSAQTDNFQRKAYGYESKEIQLSTDAFSKFAKYIEKFPIELDLLTDSYFNRENQAVTIITGIVE